MRLGHSRLFLSQLGESVLQCALRKQSDAGKKENARYVVFDFSFLIFLGGGRDFGTCRETGRSPPLYHALLQFISTVYFHIHMLSCIFSPYDASVICSDKTDAKKRRVRTEYRVNVHQGKH